MNGDVLVGCVLCLCGAALSLTALAIIVVRLFA